MRKFNIFETKWGTGAVIYSDKGLAGLVFPHQNQESLEEEVALRFGECEHHDSIGKQLISTLGRYFDGKKVQFAEQLDLGRPTEFQRQIYETLKSISYGETTTYAELAALCGRPKAARAVGNAMARNPIPIIIPCHRVLHSDGAIGGWSGKPGWKERLLAIEGITTG